MSDEMPDEIWLTRESDKPNDIKVWGMGLANSTKYTKAPQAQGVDVVKALQENQLSVYEQCCWGNCIDYLLEQGVIHDSNKKTV